MPTRRRCLAVWPAFSVRNISGNVVVCGVYVALVYWIVYVRGAGPQL